MSIDSRRPILFLRPWALEFNFFFWGLAHHALLAFYGRHEARIRGSSVVVWLFGLICALAKGLEVDRSFSPRTINIFNLHMYELELSVSCRANSHHVDRSCISFFTTANILIFYLIP